MIPLLQGTITRAGLEEVAFSENTIGVDYADMPGVLIDSVFPQHFGLDIGEKEEEAILAQFSVYSKRIPGGRNSNKQAKNDSKEKQAEASDATRAAAALFMDSWYEHLVRAGGKGCTPAFERSLTVRTAKEQSYVYDPVSAARERRLTTVLCPVVADLN